MHSPQPTDSPWRFACERMWMERVLRQPKSKMRRWQFFPLSDWNLFA